MLASWLFIGLITRNPAAVLRMIGAIGRGSDPVSSVRFD
jgi:hypothetical protein